MRSVRGKSGKCRPLEEDDRVMEIIGWFMPGIINTSKLHCKTLRAASELKITADWASAHIKDSVMGRSPSSSPRTRMRGVSLAEWEAIVSQLGTNQDIEGVDFAMNAFVAECNNRCTLHMDTEYPPSARVFLADDPTLLGVDRYDLAGIARASVEAMDADGNCVHALVDYDYAGGYNNYGHMYSPYPLFPMTWRTWVDFGDWGPLGEAQAATGRRVVWGTYPGPHGGAAEQELHRRLSRVDHHLLRLSSDRRAHARRRHYLTLTDNPRDQVEHEEFPDIEERPIVQRRVAPPARRGRDAVTRPSSRGHRSGCWSPP